MIEAWLSSSLRIQVSFEARVSRTAWLAFQQLHVCEGGLGAEEVGQVGFQLQVRGEEAADEPDRGGAGSPPLRSFDGGLDYDRVVGEAEVVVRAEADGLAPVGEGDRRALGGVDRAERLHRAGGVELGELALEVGLEAAHAMASTEAAMMS